MLIIKKKKIIYVGGSYTSTAGNGLVCTNIVSCTSTVGYSGSPPNCVCTSGYRYLNYIRIYFLFYIYIYI